MMIDINSSNSSKIAIFSLIAANLVPLAGVWFWGWSLLSIILLYWLENGIIGFYNALKMMVIGKWSSWFFVLFFSVHYSIFMLVHLVFIFVLFVLIPGKPITLGPLAIPFASLLLSHGISFFANFISKKEYLNSTAILQLFTPYPRIFVMQLTLILGGTVIMVLGTPVVALMILILLKTALDLHAHNEEHRSSLEMLRAG
ncbi:MAG: DUF6498-containing protein [Candidatus Margulisiibacteriota bacterium]